MFPQRENKRMLVTALVALLLSTQLVLYSMTIVNYISNVQPQTPIRQPEPQNIYQQLSLLPLKDNWQLLTYDIRITNEKINNLAEKYRVDPEYLDYIVKVEKIFNLEPCELLALIAAESGFKPQTRMDGGSLSYSTTQMKMPTAKTAYMAITEYYNMNIPYPTHQILSEDKYYAAFLAGGYLRYLHDSYQNKNESYTAYNWGIGGRMIFYNQFGHFKSPYAVKVAGLSESFRDYVGKDYHKKTNYNYQDQVAIQYLEKQIS